MFIIEWRENAVRQFERILDERVRKQILFGIDALRAFPKCNNIKMLKNHKYDYRLRIGRYRILFNVATHIEVVYIERVAIRDEQTY